MFGRKKNWVYSKPRAAHGGIRSRTGRSRFCGSNWWSRRWIQILEQSIDSARLARGRTYARNGQVVDIEIEPGLVTASVQGSRKTPYQIRLGFETMTERAKSLLLFRFRERASFTAKLLAGGMPEEMEKVFKEANVQLFPDRVSIQRFKCSCPDEAVPCKHIIAVLFLLAEVFDDDPFLILKLRGINKDTLINLLTMETACGDEDAYSSEQEEWDSTEDLPVISGGSEINEKIEYKEKDDEDVMLQLDKNWYSGAMPAFSYITDDKQQNIAALDILNEFPFWRGEQPFRQSLKPCYERAARSAEDILSGERRKSVGRPRKLI
jgi:uncharacterized Zn finger protein